MKYFKIKPEFDQRKRKDGSILVENELYTEREMNRYEIPTEYTEPIELDRKETYWLFGARFY